MAEEQVLASEGEGEDLICTSGSSTTKESLFFQYEGKSTNMREIIDRCIADWRNTSGSDTKLESVDVYLKPEDGKGYYVINRSTTGAIDI